MEAYSINSLEKVYVFSEEKLHEVRINALVLEYYNGDLRDHYFKLENKAGTPFKTSECYASVEDYIAGNKLAPHQVNWEDLFHVKERKLWFLDHEKEVKCKDLEIGSADITIERDNDGCFTKPSIGIWKGDSPLYASREEIFLHHDIEVEDLGGNVSIYKNPYHKTQLTSEQKKMVDQWIEMYKKIREAGVDLGMNYEGTVFAINQNDGASFNWSRDRDNERHYFPKENYVVGTLQDLSCTSEDLNIVINKE